MRRSYVAFLVTGLLASAGAHAQSAPPAAETVEELGRGILAALRSGSFEDMEHLLPTADDLLEMIEYYAASQGASEEQLQAARSEIPEAVATTRDELAAEFDRVREPWREIDWASATMRGVRITVRDPETYEERQVDDATLAAEQWPGADVQVLFEAGGESREIDLQDCFKSSRGWLVMEALRLRQPQEPGP